MKPDDSLESKPLRPAAQVFERVDAAKEEFRLAALSMSLAALCIAAVSGCNKKSEVTDLAESDWVIAKQSATVEDSQPSTISDLVAAGWTVTPTSLPEIERQLGSGNSDWIAFKAKFKPEDTVVRLVAPNAYWANSAGWYGYAIVRSGTVVAELVVSVS